MNPRSNSEPWLPTRCTSLGSRESVARSRSARPEITATVVCGKRGERADGGHRLGQRPGRRSGRRRAARAFRRSRTRPGAAVRARCRARAARSSCRGLRSSRSAPPVAAMVELVDHAYNLPSMPSVPIPRQHGARSHAYGAGEVRRQAASPARARACPALRRRGARAVLLEEERCHGRSRRSASDVYCAVQRVEDSALCVVGHRGSGGQGDRHWTPVGLRISHRAPDAGRRGPAGARAMAFTAPGGYDDASTRVEPSCFSSPTSPVSRSAATTAPAGPLPAVTATILAGSTCLKTAAPCRAEENDLLAGGVRNPEPGGRVADHEGRAASSTSCSTKRSCLGVFWSWSPSSAASRGGCRRCSAPRRPGCR